jgi:hypothetical protein
MEEKGIDNNLFQSILENIDPDLDDEQEIKSKAFDFIDLLVDGHFEDDFCQLLINSIKPNTDLRKVSRVLDILIWSTPDNGSKLDKLTSNWLISNDKLKIKVILFRKDWLPKDEHWPQERGHIKRVCPELNFIVDYYSNELNSWRKTGLRRIDELKEIIKTAGSTVYIA